MAIYDEPERSTELPVGRELRDRIKELLEENAKLKATVEEWKSAVFAATDLLRGHQQTVHEDQANAPIKRGW